MSSADPHTNRAREVEFRVDDAPLCKVCGGVGGDHDLEKHKQVLDAKAGKEPKKAEPEKKQLPQVPRDPVLRALLVRKGVVTATELAEADEELRATGAFLS